MEHATAHGQAGRHYQSAAGESPGIVVDTRHSPHSRLRPVPLSAIELDDAFWTPRLLRMRDITLPSQLEQCERSGRIDNFRRAAGRAALPFQGRFYNDSDVYKWLEAASYALATRNDPALAERVDALIADIAAAQGADGYLNTYFTFERAGERFTNLSQLHELYCAGHFLQAAVAHHRATGKRSVLDIAVRLADYLSATFGPEGRHGTDGHEEIELALVELYRATGNQTYRDRATFFLDERGRKPSILDGSTYLQDHLPVREQDEMVGHAVRATYLACGIADVALETGETALWDAAERLWESAFQQKMYVTGGLGAHHAGESFGSDYELPNERAYAESCAAIGAVMWNWRMLQRDGAAYYADALETALYNGVLAGLGLDGISYFYVNPLADRGHHRRQLWFDCACCPPNLARLLLSMPAYAYSLSAEGAWVHLYAAGSAHLTVRAGTTLDLQVETDYPWDGAITIRIVAAPATPLSLFLRIPGWCRGASVRVNGEPFSGQTPSGRYVEVRRAWHPGETVQLALPMPVRQVVSHPHVTANTGRVALLRGPLVYCLEAADHPESDVWDIAIPSNATFIAERVPDLLGGVVLVRSRGVSTDASCTEPLYRVLGDRPPVARRTVPIVAIPFHLWANRAAGPMAVWLPSAPPLTGVTPAEEAASGLATP